MLKRYKYRVYPTKDQVQHFNQTFGSVRVVYNKYVETNLTRGKLVSYSEACRDLTALKHTPEYEWLNQVSSTALQQSLKDATQGVKNFFKNPKRVRPPRFKKRGYRESYRVVGENSFQTRVLNRKWGTVRLPKIGEVKYRVDRPLPSKPSSVTVIKEPNGTIFVSFVVETTPITLPETPQKVAVDLGLKTYGVTVTNTGKVEELPNPRYYRKAEKKLGRLQQVLSTKQKGSRNRDKARLKVAKQHQKIVNQRKDFINKFVSRLVNENQVIITETLSPANMVKNHKLAKSIMDAGWGLFLTQLTSKTQETGREHVKVDPYYPSSKTCNKCGTINQTLALSDREWVCACGTVLNRDLNACLNLLAAGRAERVNALTSSNTGGELLTSLG